MLDPLTLGALALGVLCLLLWYVNDRSQRDRMSARTVGRLIEMPTDDPKDDAARNSLPVPVRDRGLPARLVRDLPQHIDDGWVERRVMQNIELFRGTNGLLEAFLFNLRDRYRSKWELEMLARVEEKLDAQVRVMEKGAHHAAVRRTLHERTETERLDTTLSHQKKVREMQTFQAEGPHAQRKALTEAEAAALKAENDLLEAKLKNQQLQRKLASGDNQRERVSEEQAAYERGRRQQRTQRAEQKGALDEDIEMQERMRREFEAKKRDIENDDTRTAEEKAAAINQLRTQYGKIFAREY